ncbi:hypothetical protein NMY22_g9387 [Coprinellus aureogranulatus]|nr:hypothetical protein NMY22_g9387 [Coprinellus aureogranulatus]
MPSRPLPLELTDLIVDELGQGPRSECLQALIACSTASRAFVQACQKHIFWSVTLLAPIDDRGFGGHVSRNARDLARRTHQFVQAVAHSPRLRSLVRDVIYQVSGAYRYGSPPHDIEPEPEVAGVLERLQGATSFTLSLHQNSEDDARGSTFVSRSFAHRILMILDHIQIKLFNLEGIHGFPLDVLTSPTSLEHISFLRSSLSMYTPRGDSHPAQ